MTEAASKKPGKTDRNKGGRPPGSQNKLTVAAKEAFQIAFDKLGGSDALYRWAVKNRETFFRLYARLIPLSVTGQFSGLVAHTHEHEHRGVIDVRKLSDDELAEDFRRALASAETPERKPGSAPH